MEIQDFIGRDGVEYSHIRVMAGDMPFAAMPAKARYKPEPPREPIPISSISVVPFPLWDGNGPYGMDMEVKLIVLKKSDVKLPEYIPPPRRVIDGYKMVAEGTPYFFDKLCPMCGTKLSLMGTENASWTHNYACKECKCLVVMDEGDKMGGGFDHWELFKPLKELM